MWFDQAAQEEIERAGGWWRIAKGCARTTAIFWATQALIFCAVYLVAAIFSK